MTAPTKFSAWCSPHDCAPLECIALHRKERETPPSFLQEMVLPEGCDHYPRTTRYNVYVGGVLVKIVSYCNECKPSEGHNTVASSREVPVKRDIP